VVPENFHIPPQGLGGLQLKILRSRGSQKSKLLDKCEPKLEFSEERGRGGKPNMLPWEGYRYFL